MNEVTPVQGLRPLGRPIDSKDAPRKFTVLPSAKDVPERKCIESICGDDLGACKVRVYEFAVPINDQMYADDLKAKFNIASGQKFWIGLLLNDVDTIGVDEQPLEIWPSTYTMFSMLDKGAVALFE